MRNLALLSLSDVSQDTSQSDLQAELERTRTLLREMLSALLKSGYVFHRESPMSQWWNEDMRRPKVDA